MPPSFHRCDIYFGVLDSPLYGVVTVIATTEDSPLLPGSVRPVLTAGGLPGVLSELRDGLNALHPKLRSKTG